MTPEGKVKQAVTRLLSKYKGIYFWMPVQTGYGSRSLDFLGCYRGRFFAVETKAPGKKPTPLQHNTIAKMTSAGATVFVIDGDVSELKQWLDDAANKHSLD